MFDSFSQIYEEHLLTSIFSTRPEVGQIIFCKGPESKILQDAALLCSYSIHVAMGG